IALLGLSVLNSYSEGPEVFHTVVRIRLAAIGMLAVVLFLLGSNLGRRCPRELTLLFVLVMGITFHALALALPSQASEQYDRMNLVVVGLAVLITWSAAWATAACATMTAVYVIGALLMWREPATTDFAHHLIRLVLTSIVTIGATAIRERRRWQDVVN